MKNTFIALALLIPVTASAAPPAGLDKAHSLALILAYDQKCMHLPDPVQRKLSFALDAIPIAERDNAIGHMVDMVRRQGTDYFCATLKDFMAEAFKP